MTDLTFYDAAVPPAQPPQTDGVAFYIGGDAVHVWSLAEIEATTVRYRLPIFVRSAPAGACAVCDAAAALHVLGVIGAPKGSLVAWDTETAADPAYMGQLYALVTRGGYRLMDYGSQSALFENELPAGGYYWGADWTGSEHVDPGDAGTQYVNDPAWDLSIFKPGLPFWDTHTNQPAPTWQEHMMKQLPTIQHGATGNAVKTVQGLCVARGYAHLAVDGVFGTNTEDTIRMIQAGAEITIDGIVGPQTWPALLGVA